MASTGLAHSVPPFKTGAKNCARCGKDFHLFRQRKNCRNCGCVVCESCSNYRARLPQFGYVDEVRCCAYCAHFLMVHKMDFAALSKLNVKTLRGYLRSYNISTQGMLEKQDLIKAIQSYKPIPEASEQYFRSHMPDSPEKTTSLFGELSNLGRSDSPSGSSQDSLSSSGGGHSEWSWDLDKFFGKLFGSEEQQSLQPDRARSQQSQPRPQAQQRPQQQTQSQPYVRPGQAPPRPYQQQPRPQQQQQRPTNGAQQGPPTYPPPNTAPPPTNGSYRPPAGTTNYRPPAHHAPPSTSTNTSYAQGQHYHRGTTSSSSSPTPPRPRQSPAPAPAPAPASAPSSPAPPKMTLDNILSSNTNPSSLSIKVIKTLLDDSCVSYVGVVEKQDLVDRLQKLIDNTKAERESVAESESRKSTPSASASNEDDNMCKICCDASLNCVMLNCNHMSTCMDCGKLIMEGSRMCPICREYVVRLLHVFRA